MLSMTISMTDFSLIDFLHVADRVNAGQLLSKAYVAFLDDK
jgi:hypothetical protein